MQVFGWDEEHRQVGDDCVETDELLELDVLQTAVEVSAEAETEDFVHVS